MKFKTIYIILLCFTVQYIYAQVPGYIGKRFLLSANIGPNITFPFTTNDNNYLDNLSYGEPPYVSKLKINLRFGGSIDYVYNRRNTIGVKCSFVQTGLSMPVYYNNSGSSGYGVHGIGGGFPATIKCNSIGLRWTRYTKNRNLPAPLGYFYGFNVGAGIAQLDYKKKSFYEPDGKLNNDTRTTKILTDFVLFGGIRRGLGKRLMWGLTVDLNLACLGYFAHFANFSLNDSGYTDIVDGTSPAGKTQYVMNDYLIRSAYYYSSMINLGLEITFLPF